MRYYFLLSEQDNRITNMINGETISPVKLFAESEAIKKDFETNPLSDWWGVWKHGTSSFEFADFATKAEAEEEYLANENEEMFCRMHDL